MWIPTTQQVTLDLGGSSISSSVSYTSVFSSDEIYKLPKNANVPTIEVVTGLSLERGVLYVMTGVYVSNGTIQFDIDLWPDTLPQILPTATSTPQLLNWAFVTDAAEASDCKIRIFNDLVRPKLLAIHM